jgi:hypothetical protein
MTKGEAATWRLIGICFDREIDAMLTCTSTTKKSGLIPGDQETDDSEGCDVDNGLVNGAKFNESTKALSLSLTIRQKVPLTAPGMDTRGLGVSEAARPTSSVPATLIGG